MMFLEMAAYVGDVLSFYTDTQLRESFLTLAQEDENLYNMAYAMGYKPKVTTAASTDLELYQLVPSTLTGDEGYVPDWDYALTIKANSSFSSTEGPKFHTVDAVRFNFSSIILSHNSIVLFLFKVKTKSRNTIFSTPIDFKYLSSAITLSTSR